MRRSGILIATAALAAALVASESEAASKGSGGIYPWYRYGYHFENPYGATVPPEYVVTGRSVAPGPGLVYDYPGPVAYCAYGYDYPYGCPFVPWLRP